MRMSPTAPVKWVYESDSVLPLVLNRHTQLYSIARPIMEDIHQYLEGAETALLLTDSTGCLLEYIGDEALLNQLKTIGLRQGLFLDEGRAGTNAIALALFDGTPAQVTGAEHFLAPFHPFGTSAAPIFDLPGHPVGAIGLVYPAAHTGRQPLGTVVAAARAIENQLQSELLVSETTAHAAQILAILGATTEGILAWTAQGLITHLNDQAGRILNLASTAAVGHALNEYFTLPEGLARAVAEGEEVSDQEVTFNLPDNPVECMISLRVIRDLKGNPESFIATLRRSEQVHQLVSRLVGARARLTLDDMVGTGPAARRIRKQALTAAGTRASVLIVGETGTGKNVLARAIHNSGARAHGPFLAINCRAIPRELALGEFLGYEPGAFNAGSASGQPSKFELANGGTLFLDEIEALPLETQAALQRVIEMGDVIRLGGTRVIPTDVRIIAATTRPMDMLVAEEMIRPDLLLRLSPFVINTVPLRDRPEDIPHLVEGLLEKLNIQLGQTLTLTPAARKALCDYPWPGNIRELEAVLERAALLSEGATLDLEQFSSSITQRRVKTKGFTTQPVHTLLEAERLTIEKALKAEQGNLTRTAQILGIGRTTLWRKIKEHKLEVEAK
jgi:transcriptional regulator of acetoin/glycerol metabolism